MGSNIRQQIGAGWRTDLVVDNSEAVALLGQTQHCFCKVTAPRSKNPTGAEDQMVAA